jgi:hypothetical protein
MYATVLGNEQTEAVARLKVGVTGAAEELLAGMTYPYH